MSRHIASRLEVRRNKDKHLTNLRVPCPPPQSRTSNWSVRSILGIKVTNVSQLISSLCPKEYCIIVGYVSVRGCPSPMNPDYAPWLHDSVRKTV
ncbi:hypothetical protein B0H11DRAFT_2256967 [Mycena galericulata]|nr:hypothetical protein B0H11DRAFT_2256967 [Mycena galericulata]